MTTAEQATTRPPDNPLSPVALCRQTLDINRGYRTVPAFDVRPTDTIAQMIWDAPWKVVAVADHHDGGVTLHFTDGTRLWAWATEEVKVQLRVRHCACGATIGPLDQWCSRACYEADNGFDEQYDSLADAGEDGPF